jgi:hypothetical protein
MSLDYYLFCRNSYKKIADGLESIISINEDLELYIDNCQKTCLTEEEKKGTISEIKKDFLIHIQRHFSLLASECNSKVIHLCEHEMVDDTIDITPDKSQNIRYCKICENSAESLSR